LQTSLSHTCAKNSRRRFGDLGHPPIDLRASGDQTMQQADAAV
jgi:hypothetical protein